VKKEPDFGGFETENLALKREWISRRYIVPRRRTRGEED
jgi:hypothetical protein